VVLNSWGWADFQGKFGLSWYFIPNFWNLGYICEWCWRHISSTGHREEVNRWHRKWDVATVGNNDNKMTWTPQVNHRTPPPAAIWPWRRGGISGCLRIREFDDLLRSVDELNGEKSSESWPRWWGPAWRAASDSTDDPGPATAGSTDPGVDVDGRCGLGTDTGRLHGVADAGSSVKHKSTV